MAHFRAGALAALLSFFPLAALSHEGHSHGDEAPPTTIVTALRATAASPLFELVEMANGPSLAVFIDRFDSNEPVTRANVSVEPRPVR